MNRASEGQLDDPFTDWLAACDEALASSEDTAGVNDTPVDTNEVPAELREQAVVCLKRLEELRQTHGRGALSFEAPVDVGWLVRGTDGPSRIGRFTIERELGRGGCGVVFLAKDAKLGRMIALKVPRPEALVHRELRERFLREAQAAASLDHPNLVTVFEVGEAGPVCYIASAFVDGETLSEYLDQQTDLMPAKRAARCVLALANAVQHAHERGVLHRDIKPGNVLLEHLGVAGAGSRDDRIDPLLVPRLSDFGLAKLLDAEGDITRTGSILGTPAYMAPEQAEGRLAEIDERTDVYALGAVLYELLTGRPPLKGKSDADTLRRIVSDEPSRPSRERKDVPRDLEEISLKCLEKSPSQRYGSAAELADDLRRYLADQPVKAKAPTPLERVTKWSRRHSDLAWVAAVMLLLTTVGISTATVLLTRSYHEVEAHRRIASEQLEETRRQEGFAQAALGLAERHRESLRQELYSLAMTAAFEAWDKRWIEEVADILQKHEPTDEPEDIRSFSWYALKSLTSHPAPIVLRGHEGAVREVAVHPDGRRIVSAGDDGTIRTWDVETGELLTTIEVSTKTLNALAISPDGKTVATGNQSLELWNLERARKTDSLTWHTTTIEEAAFSPDGKYIASAARDWHIHVRSSDGKTTHRFQTGGGNQSIAFTDGGATITGVCDFEPANRIRSWDCESGELVRDFQPTSTEYARLFVPSKCGRRFIVSPNHARNLYVCDASDGREVGAIAGLRDDHNDLALSPDDSILASAGIDGILRYWHLDPHWTETDFANFAVRELTAVEAHEGEINSIAFIDQGRVATCGDDGLIKIWRLIDDPSHQRQLGDQLTRAALTPDTKYMLAADVDGFCRLSNIETGEIQWTAPHGRDAISRITFAPDGSRFATVDESNTIDVWNRGDGRVLATFHHTHDVNSVALSPDGRWLAVTGVDGYTSVWNVESTQTVFENKLDSWGESILFSPNGELLAVGGQDPEIRIIRTDSWNNTHRLRGTSDVNTMAFHPSGSFLASAHRDAAIRVWDLNSGELSTTLKRNQGSRISLLAFHPSGETLVSGCHNDSVRIWHLPTRRDLGIVWGLDSPAISWLRQLVFSPDGRSLFALAELESPPHHTLFTLHTDYPTPSNTSTPSTVERR